MKQYNPFEKIPTLSSLDMFFNTEYINGRKYKIGRLSLDRKLSFEEVMMTMKKINPYFGIYTSLLKTLDEKDFISKANKLQYKFFSSIMDVYIVDFPTTAVINQDLGNRKKKVLFRNMPRSVNIYLKRKDACIQPDPNFFKIAKGRDIYRDLDEAERRIKYTMKACARLFIENKMKKRLGSYNLVSVFGSYLNNINDIRTILEKNKINSKSVWFDILSVVDDSNEMVYQTLSFLFKRKWITYKQHRVRKKVKKSA